MRLRQAAVQTRMILRQIHHAVAIRVKNLVRPRGVYHISILRICCTVQNIAALK